MIKNIFAAAILISSLGLVSCQEKTQQNQTIAQQKLNAAPAAPVAQQTELPKLAQDFLKKYYGSAQIVKSKVDGGVTTEYEVTLSDGTELDFFKDGSLKKVESHNALPAGIVPSKIAAYAKSNYPQNFIKEYKIEDKGQKIEFDHGVEVKFDGAGNFVKID